MGTVLGDFEEYQLKVVGYKSDNHIDVLAKNQNKLLRVRKRHRIK